jgi:hypothetical protein
MVKQARLTLLTWTNVSDYHLAFNDMTKVIGCDGEATKP